MEFDAAEKPLTVFIYCIFVSKMSGVSVSRLSRDRDMQVFIHEYSLEITIP